METQGYRVLPVWSPGAEKGLGHLCGRREVAVEETRSTVIEKTEHEIHYFSLKSGWGWLGTCNSEVESRTRNLHLLLKKSL